MSRGTITVRFHDVDEESAKALAHDCSAFSWSDVFYERDIAISRLNESKEKLARLSALLDELEAEAWLVLKDARCVLFGLDDGITTAPNALVHGSLKFSVPRLERTLAKIRAGRKP